MLLIIVTSKTLNNATKYKSSEHMLKTPYNLLAEAEVSTTTRLKGVVIF